MARWRTLYELSAVSLLMQRHGDDLAERYVAHQVVESLRAARLHRRHQERLGRALIEEQKVAELKRQYDLLEKKYGKEFTNSYGWASKHLEIGDPKLAQIIEAAGIDHLQPYYKLASHNVHANPKGIFFKLGMIGERKTLLAGPSNAGLTDPGHGAAISLVQVSTTLITLNPTLDRLLALKIMDALLDKIGNAFLSAHEQLERDEEKYAASIIRR